MGYQYDINGTLNIFPVSLWYLSDLFPRYELVLVPVPQLQTIRKLILHLYLTLFNTFFIMSI